jgi:hypothetical protein
MIISSRSIVIPKIVVPVIFGGFAMLGYILILFYSDAGMSRWFLLFPTMPLMFALLVWKTSSKYADEIVDAGDCLLVRRGSIQDQVQLSDVQEVRGRGLKRRWHITLFLRKPGKFGSEINFLAIGNPQTLGGWLRFNTNDDLSTHNDIAEDLARRLNK